MMQSSIVYATFSDFLVCHVLFLTFLFLCQVFHLWSKRQKARRRQSDGWTDGQQRTIESLTGAPQ